MRPMKKAETRWRHPTTSLSTQLSLPSSEERCPGRVSTWNHPALGPVCSAPVPRGLQLRLAAHSLNPLERTHLLGRFILHREMTSLSAGLFLSDTPARRPQLCFLSDSALRPCTGSHVPTTGLHRPASPTSEPFLVVLNHSAVTRSRSALSSLPSGPWGHLHCAGTALASLASLPAKRSPAQDSIQSLGQPRDPGRTFGCSAASVVPFLQLWPQLQLRKGEAGTSKGRTWRNPPSWPSEGTCCPGQGWSRLSGGREKPETLD